MVGDTDHLNRVGGNPPLTQRMELDADGFPMLRGEMLGPAGIRHTFEEIEHRWVRGRCFVQDRVLDGPLLARTTYAATLTPEGDGVRVQIVMTVHPKSGFLSPLLQLGLAGVRREWQSLLDALPAPGELEATPQLRRIDHGLDAAFVRWQRRNAPEWLVARVRQWMRQARAWELQQLRPFVLADEAGADRREVLSWLVEGAAVGVVELVWSVRCPRCRGGISDLDSPTEIPARARCTTCRHDFGVDLEDSVEVLFKAPSSLGPRGGEMFCTLYPARRADLAALVLLDRGGDFDEELSLEPGLWRLISGGALGDLELELGEGDVPTPVEWTPESETARLDSCRITLQVKNEERGRLRLSVGRVDDAPAATAALLTTLPAYRDVFGPPSLAPFRQLAVREVTVLFTDLTDSTALYVELGDSQAYGFVAAHFELLDGIVETHGGVRVKTIGDALMAAFHDAAAGLRCALAMQIEFRRWVGVQSLSAPPGLRVGLNAGAALAVHTDSAGMDYFGGTVNLAARAASCADPGEIVWPERFLDADSMAAVLAAEPCETTGFDALLKGIPEPVRLVRGRLILA